MMALTDGYESHFVQTNGITLHVVQSGEQGDPLLILLHGFPEFWYGWINHIKPLAAQGFRVWAPDMRGYNLSDKPKGIKNYRLDILAADIAGLIKAAGREHAVIVGHDWGAIAAWYLAMTQPELVQKLVILNVPHPVAINKVLRKHRSQLLKSWYVGFFQLPLLPEVMNLARNGLQVRKSMKASSRRGTFTDAELAHYVEAWKQPNAMNRMLNYYRALIQQPPPKPESIRIKMPTLIIWGAKDKFLEREGAPLSLDYCIDGRLVMLEEATHWLHHEEADRITSLIAEFVQTGNP